MKILILTPFWKRPEIVQEYVKSVQRLKSVADIQLLAILSFEDPNYKEVLDLIDGWYFCHADNSPLGKKKNEGLEFAMEFEWDYLLELNSDSIVNSRLLEIYGPYMDQHHSPCNKEPCYPQSLSGGSTLS